MDDRLVRKIKGWLYFRIYRLNLHFDLTLYKRWKWKKYLSKNSKVLEIGSGGGPWTVELLLRNNEITSVDRAESHLGRLRRKIDSFPLKNKSIKLIKCHAKDFVSQEKYDQIILFEVLEHIKEDELVVKNLSAMLKLGGQMLISTPSKDHKVITGEEISEEEGSSGSAHVRKGYSFSDYDKMLSKNGLKVVKRESCAGFFTSQGTVFVRVVDSKVKFRSFMYGLCLLLRLITYLDFLFPRYPRYVNFVIAEKMNE